MPRKNVVAPGLQENLVASAARTASGDSGTLTGWGAASSLRVRWTVGGTTPSFTFAVDCYSE